MRNASIRGTASSTGDTLAAAIEASAAALASETGSGGSKTRLDLESAVMDASLFGRLAHYAICYLGFEKSEAPELTSDDAELVYWAVSELRGRADTARTAFLEEAEVKRIAHERAQAA